MDAAMFYKHMYNHHAGVAARSVEVAAPQAAPAKRAGELPAARPQGLAGKPPFNKDRYPAAFAGRPKGAKSKAPGRRQMASALAVAIAMATSDPRMIADSTAPDFLERFGVKKSVITKLTNALATGDMTITQATGDFRASAERGGYTGFGGGSMTTGAKAQRITVPNAEIGALPEVPQIAIFENGRVAPESKIGIAPPRQGPDPRNMPSWAPQFYAPPVGETSSAGGALPGQTTTTAPSAPPPTGGGVVDSNLPGDDGAGGAAGDYGSAFEDAPLPPPLISTPPPPPDTPQPLQLIDLPPSLMPGGVLTSGQTPEQIDAFLEEHKAEKKKAETAAKAKATKAAKEALVAKASSPKPKPKPKA